MKTVGKHIVIVGAGFAGITCARALGGKKDLHVTLLDRRNHHLFQPLLYQVAMAGLSPAEIAYPIRGLLSPYANIHVLMGEMTGCNPQEKTIATSLGTISYDVLVMACGADHSYFGHNDWEMFAPGLKTLEQATEIRSRVLLAFERAECEQDPHRQKPHLTFVVIGGGPTGVELAGALGEISRFCLNEEFHNIDPSRTRIILLEGGPRILASYGPEMAAKATRSLEQLGVQVWTNSRATTVNAQGVAVGKEFIEASTVLWAAGVEASPTGKTLGASIDQLGRVFVTPYCNLKDQPDIYVLGDQAAYKTPVGELLPGLAPVAMQQGRYVAARLTDKIPDDQPFHYIDKGQMATIGRRKAVMEAFGFKMAGLWAWLAWLFVHIYYLIGFKNRLFVFYQWTWSYFTYKRGARLIVGKEWRTHGGAKHAEKSLV